MDKSNLKSQKLGKNGNLNYFPTASPKSYWQLGSQVPIQFPRLYTVFGGGGGGGYENYSCLSKS